MTTSRFSGQPPRAQQVALVEAYGRFLGANRDGAPITSAERLRQVFNRKLDAMRRKYPDVDLASETFYENLKAHALRWWDGRALRGSGVDW